MNKLIFLHKHFAMISAIYLAAAALLQQTGRPREKDWEGGREEELCVE